MEFKDDKTFALGIQGSQITGTWTYNTTENTAVLTYVKMGTIDFTKASAPGTQAPTVNVKVSDNQHIVMEGSGAPGAPSSFTFIKS